LKNINSSWPSTWCITWHSIDSISNSYPNSYLCLHSKNLPNNISTNLPSLVIKFLKGKMKSYPFGRNYKQLFLMISAIRKNSYKWLDSSHGVKLNWKIYPKLSYHSSIHYLIHLRVNELQELIHSTTLNSSWNAGKIETFSNSWQSMKLQSELQIFLRYQHRWLMMIYFLPHIVVQSSVFFPSDQTISSTVKIQDKSVHWSI